MKDETTGGWRDELGKLLHGASMEVEEAFEKGRARLKRLMPDNRERYIQPYRSYANSNTAFVSGRVLQQKPAGGPKDDDQLWENLLNTYRRWETDEVPDEPVTLFLGGQRYTAKSDEEGYIRFQVPLEQPLPTGQLWHEGMMVLGTRTEAPSGEHDATPVSVLAPPDSATFGVISDVDDTVLHTGITNLVTAAKLTFLGNAKTRKPLDGVAALYRALQEGPEAGKSQDNPIFYISSSAWNLYDLIEDFLELNEIPAGPLLLRDLGLDPEKFIKTDHRHKLEKAMRILDAYPELPFILIGDSGQEDAKLYAELVKERPGRVKAIYIRDVDPGMDSVRDAVVTRHGGYAAAANVPLLRVEDSEAIAAHAVELGLLSPAFLESIRKERQKDENRPEL